MVDAPERIWAVTDAGMVGTGRWVTQGTENPHGNVEYVRADLYEQVKRERDELALAFNSSFEIRERLASRAEAAERLAGARVKVLEEPPHLTEYEIQVLLGTSISGCNMRPDRVFSLDMAWHRLRALELIDRADGLAIITEKGQDVVARILSALAEPAGEVEPRQFLATEDGEFNGNEPVDDRIPIAATEGREIDWVDVTGWGVFKGHAIPVEVARFIAEKINLYVANHSTPPDASAIRGVLDIPECVLSLCADKITMTFETGEDATCAFDAIEAALAGAKP